MATGVEADEQGENLPDNFDQLSAREQFKERRRLFDRLLIQFKGRRRPDLKAMGRMKETSLKFEGLGPVPGVKVGDSFKYRAEISVVGLHRTHEGGIECVNQGDVAVASSVVISGGYKDDEDRGDIIEYTGQGGIDHKGHGRQYKDQKLKGGNLALRNSFNNRTPVRVIRGHEPTKRSKNARVEGNRSKKASNSKRYSYDGLYNVAKHEFVKGDAGYMIHKFTLMRLPGQPPLDKKRKVTFDRRRYTQ